jgi:hypothetical protein
MFPWASAELPPELVLLLFSAVDRILVKDQE